MNYQIIRALACVCIAAQSMSNSKNLEKNMHTYDISSGLILADMSGFGFSGITSSMSTRFKAFKNKLIEIKINASALQTDRFSMKQMYGASSRSSSLDYRRLYSATIDDGDALFSDYSALLAMLRTSGGLEIVRTKCCVNVGQCMATMERGNSVVYINSGVGIGSIYAEGANKNTVFLFRNLYLNAEAGAPYTKDNTPDGPDSGYIRNIKYFSVCAGMHWNANYSCDNINIIVSGSAYTSFAGRVNYVITRNMSIGTLDSKKIVSSAGLFNLGFGENIIGRINYLCCYDSSISFWYKTSKFFALGIKASLEVSNSQVEIMYVYSDSASAYYGLIEKSVKIQGIEIENPVTNLMSLSLEAVLFINT